MRLSGEYASVVESSLSSVAEGELQCNRPNEQNMLRFLFSYLLDLYRR